MAALKTNKRMLYVGGLSEEVTDQILKDAFIPFGDVLDVELPLDFQTRKPLLSTLLQREETSAVATQRSIKALGSLSLPRYPTQRLR
jgi:RNA recognition motif-containing protein